MLEINSYGSSLMILAVKIYEAAGKYLNAKEELWKLKYFTMQKYNIKKIPLKETKNPS
jgi:hypothetical protein